MSHYSNSFREKMIRKMAPPNSISANQLSKEVGVSQTTLSFWLREAGKIAYMTKPSKGRKPAAFRRRPQDRSSQEKFKVVIEASSLKDEELGAFLRERGLHKAQLENWKKDMEGELSSDSDRAKKNQDKKLIRELEKRVKKTERELRRKDKALAETAALLVLKKKAQEIWGDEEDDTDPKSEK